MLYILHGDDIVSLRKRLSELIGEQGRVIFLQGDKATLSEIFDALRSSDLFLETRYIVIEKVLKLDKKTLDSIQKYLDEASSSKSMHIVLLHDTELSKVFLGKFKRANVEAFILPKLFFTFLDSFTPSSLKKELDLMLRMQNVEAEQIFYALIKRVRQLIAVKSNTNSQELLKMSPWQREKIQAQSAKWKVEGLGKIYKDLFEIEVKMKSGGLILPLRKSLDILVIDALH